MPDRKHLTKKTRLASGALLYISLDYQNGIDYSVSDFLPVITNTGRRNDRCLSQPYSVQ